MLASNGLGSLAFIDSCHVLLVYELYASALPGVTTGGISCRVARIVQRFLLRSILSDHSQSVKRSLITCLVFLVISLYVNRDHTALFLAYFVLHESRALRLCLILNM